MNKFDTPTPADDVRREAFDRASKAEQEQLLREANTKADLEHGPSLREELAPETDENKREVLEKALAIAEAIKTEGGMAYIVGGYVRDIALRRMGGDSKPNDIDFEVYGIEPDRLLEILRGFGDADTHGKQFEIMKLPVANEVIDVALPRRDVKVAPGHKGFETIPDPHMSKEEASRRRDFTVNAMFMDPFTGEISDYHRGFADLAKRTLRAVDSATFPQDPLRPLRAAQFASRFGFSIDAKTIKLSQQIDLSELPKERVGEEWMKLFLKSDKPSVGMEAARELGIIEKLHPELNALIGAEQDPTYHPEGDVWTHTKMVVDSAAAQSHEKKLNEEETLVRILGALCHDLGKPSTKTINDEGRLIHHGHSEAGIPYAKSLLKSMNVPGAVIDKVLPIVHEHMTMLTAPELSDSAVRRLAKRLYPATLEELVAVSKSDSPSGGKLDRDALLAQATELSVAKAKPEPILMGRDLIAIGFEPGKAMGDALRQIEEKFLDGQIKTKEEALKMAEKMIKSGS